MIESTASAAEGGFPPESAPPLTIPIKTSANCSDSVANSTNLLYRSFISLPLSLFTFSTLPPSPLFHLPFLNTRTHTHTHTVPAWRALPKRLENRCIWLAKICSIGNQTDCNKKRRKKKNVLSCALHRISLHLCRVMSGGTSPTGHRSRGLVLWPDTSDRCRRHGGETAKNYRAISFPVSVSHHHRDSHERNSGPTSPKE